MAENIEKARMSQKHDIDKNWQLVPDFVPKPGEIIIYDRDENHRKQRMKVGDGESSIAGLGFFAGEVYAQAKEPYNPGEGAIWIVPDGEVEEWLGDEQEPYTPVEIDKTLTIEGMAADSAATGQAIKALDEKFSQKIQNIDFSLWDEGTFTVTFVNGLTSTFSVVFDINAAPYQITDQEGNITTIYW